MTELPPATIYLCSETQAISGIVSNIKPHRCYKNAEFPSIWHIAQAKESATNSKIELVACISHNPELNYFSVKPQCRTYQQTNYYYRNFQSVLAIPKVVEINNVARTSVNLDIQISDLNLDAPIKYFGVSIKTSEAVTRQVIEADDFQAIKVEGLSPATNYTFKVSAISIDGTSPESPESAEVKTLLPAPPPPVFELTSHTETVLVNSLLTGFTVNQTGGRVKEFTISPAIDPGSGLDFNAVTGSLSGRPVSTMSATTYTVTGSNESGSYSDTYTLTVNPVLLGPTSVTLQTLFLLIILWIGSIVFRRRMSGRRL